MCPDLCAAQAPEAPAQQLRPQTETAARTVSSLCGLQQGPDSRPLTRSHVKRGALSAVHSPGRKRYARRDCCLRGVVPKARDVLGRTTTNVSERVQGAPGAPRQAAAAGAVLRCLTGLPLAADPRPWAHRNGTRALDTERPTQKVLRPDAVQRRGFQMGADNPRDANTATERARGSESRPPGHAGEPAESAPTKGASADKDGRPRADGAPLAGSTGPCRPPATENYGRGTLAS